MLPPVSLSRILCGGESQSKPVMPASPVLDESQSAPVVLAESHVEASPAQRPSSIQPPAQHHATADAANLTREIFHLLLAWGA